MRSICYRIVLTALIISIISIPVFAVSGIQETEYFPEDKAASFLDNISVTVIHEEPPRLSVKCFDVNEHGQIALGFYPAQTIGVYSPDGSFLYGYTFHSSGDYSLIWDKGCVCIYFMRSSVLATFDADGNCIDIEMYAEVADNYRYIRNTFDKSKKQLGTISYWLEKDIPIAHGYARLLCSDGDESSQILYDATAESNTSIIITLICIAFFFTCVVLIVIRQYHKRKLR